AAALDAAGFESVVSDFIEKGFWVKLLGNVTFNPVSALTVSTSDRLIANPDVKAYMVRIMREVLEIGRAVGVDADIDPEARLDMARALGKFKTRCCRTSRPASRSRSMGCSPARWRSPPRLACRRRTPRPCSGSSARAPCRAISTNRA